ncbi:MAG: DMT family transporter [Paracoccaceae bacterium]
MTALPPARFSLLTANLICMASMMVWAAGLPAADVLIGKLPPLPLTAMRMGLAAVVLLPLWWALDGWAALRDAAWGRGLVVGALSIGLGAFLLVVAQKATDAVTVAVISANMPVIGMAIECVLDGRKLTLTLVLGIVLSLAGGLMAYASSMGSLSLGIGALSAFASLVVFTLGSRVTVTSFPTLSPIGRTAITMVGAGLGTSLAALVMGFSAPAIDWSVIGWREVGALCIFSLGGMALSQVLWIMSVGQLGIGLASLHINAAPFYVMIILFALGAPWNWTQALGAAVVGLGVLIAQGVFTPQRVELT